MMLAATPILTTRTAKSVTDVRFANQEKTLIFMNVVFDEIAHLGALPFIADPNDHHHPHGPDLFKRAMAGEFGNVALCPAPTQEQIDKTKAAQAKHADNAAHAEHLRSGADFDAHSPVYVHKLDEARRVESDTAPAPENYPLLHALVGHEGVTLHDVGASIRGKDVEWRKVAADIERKRVATKAAIYRANSIPAVNEAFAALKF